MGKTPDILFRSEELQLLLEFVNANIPLPLQSVPQTLRLLDQHAQAACTEISENLAALTKDEMHDYYEWADQELCKINLYEYHMIIESHSKNALLKRQGKAPMPDTMNCQIGKPIAEGMSAEERQQLFDFSLRITDRYLDKISDVAEHLEAQYEHAKMVLLLSQDKEDYISAYLERKHQELYLKLRAITKIRDHENLEENFSNLPYLLELAFENQLAEINNNFYQYPMEITRPYLFQMHEIYSKNLLWSIAVQVETPAMEPFRQRLSEQFRELCEQLTTLQKRQEASPYLVKLSDLLPEKEPFVLFLLMWDSKMLEELEKVPASVGENVNEGIAFLLSLSEHELEEYLQIARRPSSTWPEPRQQQLKLVQEYLERLAGMKEYRDEEI